ncbi:MAG: hypothetical protein HY720_14560 [Planctomycetes bacterium]|nr:hypothetical protein [Planctomycetota bacterium]
MADEALLARLVAVSTAGQPATIENRVDTPYVAGQRPLATTGTNLVEPEVAWTGEPFTVTVQPIVTAQGRTVWLRLVASADRPLPGRTVEAAHGVVGLPAKRRQRVETVAPVPTGRCLACEVGSSSLVVARPFVRTIAGLEPPSYEPSEAEKRRARFVEALSAKKIAARFREQPLSEVLDTIRRSGGFNVLVARDFTNDGGPELLRAPFTLETESISVWELLGLLELIYPIEVELLDDVVVLRAQGNAPSRSVLATYDVQEFTVSAQEAWAHMELGSDRPEAPVELRGGRAIFEDTAAGEVWITQEELAELVRASIDPEIWDTEGSGLRLLRGRLVIAAPPETQERVAAFLADLKSEVTRGVRFRITRFRAGPALLSEFGPAEGSRLVLAPGISEKILSRLDPEKDAVETYSVAGTLERWLGVGRSDAAHYVADVRGALAEGSAIQAPATGTYHAGASDPGLGPRPSGRHVPCLARRETRGARRGDGPLRRRGPHGRGAARLIVPGGTDRAPLAGRVASGSPRVPAGRGWEGGAPPGRGRTVRVTPVGSPAM